MNPTQDYQPPAHDLARDRTSRVVNRRIDRQTYGAMLEAGDSPEGIRARLAEIDQEWHLDRALIALFSGLGSLTAGLTMRTLRRDGRSGFFGLLFWTQMSFLLYHATRGWCPPVELLRRMGFRTAREICAERCVLEKQLADAESSMFTGMGP